MDMSVGRHVEHSPDQSQSESGIEHRHGSTSHLQDQVLVPAQHDIQPAIIDDFGLPSFHDPFAALFADKNSFGGWPYRGIQLYGVETEPQFDDMDSIFLDSYNNDIPFSFTPYVQPTILPPTSSNTEISITEEDSAIMRKSCWKFVPNRNDSKTTELHHLTVGSESPGSSSPTKRVNSIKRASKYQLCLSTRDKILAMVVKTCADSNVAKAVASFPSVDLLEILLEYFLTDETMRACDFIHLPTFNPNTSRPELVAMMVAAGATLTKDPALTKLGLAIQECVRIAVSYAVSHGTICRLPSSDPITVGGK